MEQSSSITFLLLSFATIIEITSFSENMSFFPQYLNSYLVKFCIKINQEFVCSILFHKILQGHCIFFIAVHSETTILIQFLHQFFSRLAYYVAYLLSCFADQIFTTYKCCFSLITLNSRAKPLSLNILHIMHQIVDLPILNRCQNMTEFPVFLALFESVMTNSGNFSIKTFCLNWLEFPI